MARIRIEAEFGTYDLEIEEWDALRALREVNNKAWEVLTYGSVLGDEDDD